MGTKQELELLSYTYTTFVRMALLKNDDWLIRPKKPSQIINCHSNFYSHQNINSIRSDFGFDCYTQNNFFSYCHHRTYSPPALKVTDIICKQPLQINNLKFLFRKGKFAGRASRVKTSKQGPKGEAKQVIMTLPPFPPNSATSILLTLHNMLSFVPKTFQCARTQNDFSLHFQNFSVDAAKFFFFLFDLSIRLHIMR